MPERGKSPCPRRVVRGMGSRRRPGQGRSRRGGGWRASGWLLPGLVVAIVALMAVTGAVLSDAQPRSLNPQPTTGASPAPPTHASAPPGGWTVQKSDASARLDDVSCSDADHCVAVGTDGIILSTSDGGNTWRPGHSGTTHPLVGVSCPSPSICYAVSNFGDLLKTGDAGLTWSIQALKNRTPFDVSCPSTVDCITADGFATHDGGSSWQQASRLDAVSVECPTRTVCYAVRNQLGHGVILVKRGGSWALQEVTPYFLDAVTCPGVTSCVAVGGSTSGSNILTTADGRSWMVQLHSADSQTLLDVGCLTVESCFVLDGTPDVLQTTNRGRTWSWQDTGLVGRLNAISCPTLNSCFVVGSGPASTGGGFVAHYQTEMTR